MSTLIDFLLPALLVSGAALAALRLAPAAPPGLRFALASTGLLAWLVPWPSIGWPVASSLAPGVAWVDEGGAQLATIRQGLVATAETVVPSGLSPSRSWLLVFLPGVCWFVAELWAHCAMLRRFRRVGRSGHDLHRFLPAGFAGPRILVVRDSSIIAAAGVFRPTILIGDRIDKDDDTLRTALTHEACHARRRDPLRVMIVTLIARLYCFNPIVLALKRHAILAIEAGCDEECARRLGREQYRGTLARLVLDSQRHRRLALSPSLHTPGLNCTRVKLLGQGSRVDRRARLAVLLVLAAGIGSVSWGSTGSMRLWLGEWMEVTNAAHWGYDSSPISRRFERAADGMTRLLAPDGTPVAAAEFRCDGRRYPADGAGLPTLGNGVRPHSGWVRPHSAGVRPHSAGVRLHSESLSESSLDRAGLPTLVCNALDARTHRYVVTRAEESDAAVYLTETISRDGETMELTIRRVNDGRTSETTQILSRLR